MPRALAITGILLATILPSGYYVPVSAQLAYLQRCIMSRLPNELVPCNTMAMPIRGVCSQTYRCSSDCSVYYSSGFLTWLDPETNCTTIYYVQVLAPITSFTWVPHDHYLDGEAGNNINFTLDKTADSAKLAAVVGGVAFLTIMTALILHRWKKESAPYPSPYDLVSSLEVQTSCVDPVILTSMKASCVTLGESSSREEEFKRPVRRNTTSKVKRNLSKSTKRRPAAMEDSTLNAKALRSLRNSKTNYMGMVDRKLSHTILEAGDKSTEEEEDYAPQPPRASPKARRKYQCLSSRPPHDMDTSTAHTQGLGSASNSAIGLPMCTPGGHFVPHHASYCPMCGHHFSRPCGSPEGISSDSDNGQGSPVSMTNPRLVPHYNPYYRTHGHTYPRPMGPYGCSIGGPGTTVNSGVGNITHVTISGIGNYNSVKNAYRAPRTRTRWKREKNNSISAEDCGVACT